MRFFICLHKIFCSLQKCQSVQLYLLKRHVSCAGMLMCHIFLLMVCLVSDGMASMNIELTYAVSLLPPVTGQHFSGQVTKDQLLCFGNLDYHEDTYLESFLCMLQWRYDSDVPSKSCFGLWGTRNVVVEVDGSVEFMRMEKLPRESGEVDKTNLEAEHWLYLSNAFENKPARETVRVNAEPIYICARSNQWGVTANTTSSFNLQFRSAYIRQSDRKFSLQQMFIQSIMAFGMSLPVVSSIIGSLSAATAFHHFGLNYFIIIFSTCMVFLFSTPVICTSKSRQTTRTAFHQLYFSTGEVNDITQKAWLLYQSFYLSSLIVCVGSITSYCMFSIGIVEREQRNNIIRISLGVSSASFFYFFIARLYPVFSRQYMWVLFSFPPIITAIRENINKESQNEVLLSIYAILIASNIFYHRVSQVPIIARVRRDLVHALLTSLFGFTIAASDEENNNNNDSNCSNNENEAEEEEEKEKEKDDCKRFFPVCLDPLADNINTCLTHVLFLNTHDDTTIKALKSSAACLGQIHKRELDPIETLEHSIEYRFSSDTVAIDSLERIAVLSEECFCCNTNPVACQHCHLCPQSRFLSMKTDIDGHRVILRVCRTSEKSRSSPLLESVIIPCVSCDNQKSTTVYHLIAIIKNELSISPSSISLETSSSHSHSKPFSVFSTRIPKEMLLLHSGGEDTATATAHSSLHSWAMSKPWPSRVQECMDNFHKALCFPSRLPCPYAAISLEIEEGNGSLSMSVCVDVNNLTTSLSEEETGIIIERLQFYNIIIGDDKKKNATTVVEDVCMECLCVSAMVVCLNSLRKI